MAKRSVAKMSYNCLPEIFGHEFIKLMVNNIFLLWSAISYLHISKPCSNMNIFGTLIIQQKALFSYFCDTLKCTLC